MAVSFEEVRNTGNDASSAFAAAVLHSDNTGELCTVPGGHYRVNLPIRHILQGAGVVLRGAGAEAVTIDYYGGGHCFDFVRMENVPRNGRLTTDIGGMSLRCFNPDATSAISVEVGDGVSTGGGALASWRRSLHGLRCEYGSYAWQRGLRLHNATFATVDDYVFLGLNLKGVALELSGTLTGVDNSFDKVRVHDSAQAFDISGNCEGVNISNLSAVHVGGGIRWRGDTPNPLLTIRGAHINTVGRAIETYQVANVNVSVADLYLASPQATAFHMDAPITTVGEHVLNGLQIKGVGAGAKTATAFCLRNQTSVIVDSGSAGNLAVGMHIAGGCRDINVNPAFRMRHVTTPYTGQLGALTRYGHIHTSSIVVMMQGGSVRETIDVDIPPGQFNSRPMVGALIESYGSQGLVAKYEFDDPATTAANARFTIHRTDGRSILRGGMRFGVLLAPSVLSG